MDQVELRGRPNRPHMFSSNRLEVPFKKFIGLILVKWALYGGIKRTINYFRENRFTDHGYRSIEFVSIRFRIGHTHQTRPFPFSMSPLQTTSNSTQQLTISHLFTYPHTSDPSIESQIILGKYTHTLNKHH